MPEQARAVGDALRDGGWVRGARLALLDFDVAFHSDDPSAIELLDELYAPLRVPGEPAHALSMGRAIVDGRPGLVCALDGGVIVRTGTPTVAFAHLLFEANQQAIEQTPGAVRVHAAGAVAGDQAIVLPGPMGAGKSTLVAGLVVRGLAYLSDEVVALDPATGLARPYAKPLSLGTPPEELSAVRWDPPAGALGYLGGSGLVPAAALGTEAVAARPALVVLPRYEPGAPTELARMTAGEALAAVASHTFRLEQPGTLPALARLLEGVPVYRLVSSVLDEAVDAVLELVSRRAEIP